MKLLAYIAGNIGAGAIALAIPHAPAEYRALMLLIEMYWLGEMLYLAFR